MIGATLLVAPLLMSPPLRAADPPSLVFVHATVIDASAPPRVDVAVALSGGRITAVGPASQVPVADGARVIDARGLYVIPGLWDMHIHALRPGRSDTWFPRLVSSGITGIRDMGGDMDLAAIAQLRAAIDLGERVGPRIVAPGPILDGPHPTLPQLSVAIDDPAQARETVRRLAKGGADFIKVYNGLSRESYFAIADETRRLHLPFAGHVPFSVSALEASQAGQRSIEHLFNILFACSSREHGLMQLKQQSRNSVDANERVLLRRAYLQGVLDSYDATKAQALFRALARNHTWQVPTLVTRRQFSFETPDALGDDPRVRDLDDEDRNIQRRFYRQDTALIAPMLKAGVRFMAGSDAPNPGVEPGESLHEELVLLVRAGLTPLQALESATLEPARYLGRERELGAVAPGKLADLVLLDANPLEDIRNTRRIAGVVAAGRYFGRREIGNMQSAAKTAGK